MKWFGTVRGRLGFTPLNNLMIFATGGLAFGRIEYAGNINRSAILVNFNIPGSDTATPTGWTVGGGVEYALTNRWSVKGEYLYYDLGNETSHPGSRPRRRSSFCRTLRITYLRLAAASSGLVSILS